MAELSNAQQLEVNRQVEKVKKELESSYISYDKLATLTGFNKDIIAIVHKSIAKGTTVSEFAYFLMMAKSTGLNPLNKEIWCYKDNKDNLLVFTGRDGFLKKNKESKLYRGMRSSEVMEFDEFEIDMIEGTVKHKISTNRGEKILGAYCIVYVEGQKDTVIYIDFEEFNLGQAKWKSSPKMMIKKCAQSLALKEAAGVTGIQAEEAFTITTNGTLTSMKEIENSNGTPERDRLFKMIEAAKTVEKLKQLLGYCEDPETIAAYDKKLSELQKQTNDEEQNQGSTDSQSE